MTRASASAATRRCAIYTRKSTAAGLEREFTSLDAQREACEAYVRARAAEGWRLLPDRYDDGGFTGANTERPAFQRLLDDVDAGRVDLVVVAKVDRLSRSLLDFAKVMERLERAGAAFVSVTQNFSTADAMGRLTLNMLMSFAEFERAMIAERTREKVAASRRRGKWTGGAVPLGYDVAGGKLVPNEREAAVVREVFALYGEEKSALAVARALNARGHRTKGRHGDDGARRPGPPWTKDAVLRVVKNPLYVGLMPYGRERHPGEHQALVAPETFARTQALLGRVRPRSRSTATRSGAYELAGLARCGACGGAMTTASTRRGGRAYRYYRCARRDRAGQAACAARAVPAAALEAFVRERLRAFALEEALVARVRAAFDARLERARGVLLAERGPIDTELERLGAEADALARALARCEGAGREVLAARLDALGAELGALRARRGEVERGLAGLNEAGREGAWALGVLAAPDVPWEALSPTNARRLFDALLEGVVVDANSGRAELLLALGGRVDGGPLASDPLTPATKGRA